MRKPALILALAISLVAGLSCSDGSAPARAPRHPPVVMIVFDEFSTTSLLDGRHRIDPVRYPHFAELAGDATWFPNATASLDETGRAMRALMTGRNTWQFAKPTFEANRRNIFTLMARSYRLNVSEEVTSLCPRRLCPSSRRQTQRSIRHKLAAGRPQRLTSWLRSVHPSSKPTFYFKHVLFPHAPWRYLPSGRRFLDGRTQRLYSWRLVHFNRWLVNQSYQRHLFQVGFTDRLLGRVLDRLKATGLYDRALIVVTADNGEGFGRLGNGHEISRKNAGDIAITPLIVKLPGQKNGRIARRHVRTIDVVPTIARIAHVRPPRRVEGRSVFGPAARRIPSSVLLVKRSGQRLRLSLGSLKRRVSSTLRLKLRLFGSGAGRPGLLGLGPRRSLHGTPVSRLNVLAPGRTRAAIDATGRYGRVRRSSGFVPVRVMGKLTGRGSRKRIDIAVAVNGTITATAPTFAPRRGAAQLFSVFVPESALREGANKVELYQLVRGTKLRPLTP